MPDARIASALRKIFQKESKCRRAASLERQPMIYGHFQSMGAYDAAKGLSDLFNISLQKDDVQDFDTRWDQILLRTSEMPPEGVLEGLYRNRLQASEQPRIESRSRDAEL